MVVVVVVVVVDVVADAVRVIACIGSSSSSGSSVQHQHQENSLRSRKVGPMTTISAWFIKAMFAPPPTASPLMAITNGLGKSQKARTCQGKGEAGGGGENEGQG